MTEAGEIVVLEFVLIVVPEFVLAVAQTVVQPMDVVLAVVTVDVPPVVLRYTDYYP